MNYLRYTGVSVGTGVAIALVLWLIEELFGADVSASGTAVVPPMIAAMVEGQNHARVHRAVPDGPSAWRFAVIATAISVAIALVALAAAIAVQPGLWDIVPATFASSDRWLLIGIGLFLTGATLLVSRYFLTMGARNLLKAQDQRGGKA